MTTLRVDDLGLSYGSRAVLEAISLPALDGPALIGILGPNGVGKSTFLRALAGINGFSGHVALDAESVSGMPFSRRVGLIGYLPQELPQATTLVAYEAVISACRAVRPDLSTAAVEQAAEEVFDRLGIRHLAFERLNQLSGGQRQMIGLAQVVVRKPAVMLLDEPTSSLDLRWQIAVFDVVRAIIAERAGLCLMALHDINLALRHCDYIALFSGGRLLSFGLPAHAMTRERLRRTYGIDGRIELSSDGRPFAIADGIAASIDDESISGNEQGENRGHG